MIYICIPAHDEAHTIGLLLWKIRKVMAEFERDYEILVFDDASTDDTAEVLERYSRFLPLTVLHEESRIGYARAQEKLIRLALERTDYPKRDSVVTLQGDFTEHPEYIVPLVKTLEGGADVVAGTVEAARPEFPRRIQFVRWLASFLLRKAFEEAPVSDPLCGFRAYRLIVWKKALRALDDGALAGEEGWAANVELLRLAAAHARRIEEVPLDLRFDIRERESRFDVIGTLRGLLRVRSRKNWTVAES